MCAIIVLMAKVQILVRLEAEQRERWKRVAHERFLSLEEMVRQSVEASFESERSEPSRKVGVERSATGGVGQRRRVISSPAEARAAVKQPKDSKECRHGFESCRVCGTGRFGRE